MRRFGPDDSPDAILKYLQQLRCPARVVAAGLEDAIGGVEDRSVLGGHDDRRVRWCWWLDEDAVRRALGGAP
jgi:hypothetical protein